MLLRKLSGVFSIVLVIGAATFAMAGVPDLFLSTASTAAGTGVNPVLYNLPNQLGSPFTLARVPGGAIADATITLTVLDGGGNPVANFSASDMWLEKEVVAGTGNFSACTGGAIANFNTNASGVTQWSAALRAGGWSTSKTLVVINGSPLTSNTGLLLRHNSADINGDRAANLSDIPLFASDFYGAYAFRSDLQFDGVVNLSDIPKLASGIGATCQ